MKLSTVLAPVSFMLSVPSVKFAKVWTLGLWKQPCLPRVKNLSLLHLNSSGFICVGVNTVSSYKRNKVWYVNSYKSFCWYAVVVICQCVVSWYTVVICHCVVSWYTVFVICHCVVSWYTLVVICHCVLWWYTVVGIHISSLCCIKKKKLFENWSSQIRAGTLSLLR